MVATTNLQMPLLSASQSQKHVTVNQNIQLLDALVQTIIVQDKDLTTPPGSPGDGQLWIPGASSTGAWTGWDFNLAWYINGAWVKIVPLEGWQAWVTDEDFRYIFLGVAGSGGNWSKLAPDQRPQPVDDNGTSITLALADENTVKRCTNGSAITVTVPPNASVAFPIGSRIEVEQAGAGQITFAPGSGVTLDSKYARLKSEAQYAKIMLYKRATNTWTLTGELVT